MVLSVYCCMNFQAGVGMENCVNKLTVCSMFNHTEKTMDNEENDNSEGDDIVKVTDEIWELNDSEMHEVTESKKAEDAEATFLATC